MVWFIYLSICFMSGNVPRSSSSAGHPDTSPYTLEVHSHPSLLFIVSKASLPPLSHTQHSSSHTPLPHHPIFPPLTHLVSLNYAHPKALRIPSATLIILSFLPAPNKLYLGKLGQGRAGRKG